MFRLLRRLILIPVLVVFPIWLAIDEGVPGLIFGWLFLGYLLVRAMPAVVADVRWVWSKLPGGKGAHGGFRVMRASRGDL